MNQEKRILVCEDSMEGIFSAVYDGWKECAGGCKVSIQTSFPVSMELFTSYREIATDQSKVGKVMRTILMRLGSEVYEQICLAAASADEDRGTAIYYVLHRAFGGGQMRKTCNGGTGRSICIQGCETGTLREAGISPLFWVCPFQGDWRKVSVGKDPAGE